MFPSSSSKRYRVNSTVFVDRPQLPKVGSNGQSMPEPETIPHFKIFNRCQDAQKHFFVGLPTERWSG